MTNEFTPEVQWHGLAPAEAVRQLDVDPGGGLANDEVARRRQRHGLNQISARRGPPVWVTFFRQFNQALIYILIAATAVSAALGEWVDAGVIFAVVFINAVAGFVQESKAGNAIAALARTVHRDATVRRDGRRWRVPAVDLVPGDIVSLQSGDLVPADLRLLAVRNLLVDESALTGESVPAHKTIAALPTDTVIGDRRNLAFAGTAVTGGQADGVVVATGDGTETGRIATMIHEADNLSTPLARKIAEFSRLLVCVILGLAGLTFVAGLLRGETATDMFMAAIALAVAAIPEGLPAAVTITLAIAVSRMARRHAIIRHLPVVEALGSTTVICSDKTGTLTENEMTVSRIVAGGEEYDVTGAGYDAHGEFCVGGATLVVSAGTALHECLLCGLLCNDARLIHKDGRLQVEGDPTEAALIVAAKKAGFDADREGARLPRLDVLPFESEHMYMATLHRSGDSRIVYLKGSAERVVERCAHELDPAGAERPLDATRVMRAAEAMSAEGLRVLAFARRRGSDGPESLGPDEVAAGLTLLGLQGMIDPPRAEAIDAVAECRSAGIEVKMITGDHAGTASAVACQLGLRAGREETEGAAVTGRELELTDDRMLLATVRRATVFARVAPEQKLRLVRALQADGHIVAMTGDGVNDAPALKQADIGVAMGITGTDVAKGAADMVLTDDNFASIKAAVEEGRQVFDNLTKFIAWTMPTSGGEGLLILASVLFGTRLPILPVQLLWVNMTTALLLGSMLVFEPKEAGIMARPPRAPQQPILTSTLVWRIVLVSLAMVAGAYALFLWETGRNASLAEARTTVVNLVVVVELFYLFNCRSLTHSIFAPGFFANRWVLGGAGAMLAMQMLFTYAPFMNRLFHSAPLGGAAWLRITGVGLFVFVVVEMHKGLRGRRGRPVPAH